MLLHRAKFKKAFINCPAEKPRLQLELWFFDELLLTFHGRILSIDERLITTWAKMLAGLKSKGLIRPSLDSKIEATALQHNLILVTRNEKNFRDTDVSVFNPWDE